MNQQEKAAAEVLGLDTGSISREDLKGAFKASAKQAHPDLGGSTAKMQDVNAAKDTIDQFLNHQERVSASRAQAESKTSYKADFSQQAGNGGMALYDANFAAQQMKSEPASRSKAKAGFGFGHNDSSYDRADSWWNNSGKESFYQQFTGAGFTMDVPVNEREFQDNAYVIGGKDTYIVVREYESHANILVVSPTHMVSLDVNAKGEMVGFVYNRASGQINEISNLSASAAPNRKPSSPFAYKMAA